MTINISGKYLYLCSLAIFLFDRILLDGIVWNANYGVVIGSLDRIVRIISNVFLVLACLKSIKRRRNKEYIMCSIALILIYISYRVTGDIILLYTMKFVLVACWVNVSFNESMRVYFKTIVVSLIGVIGCNLIGFTANTTVEFSYGVGHGVGMAHPNNFAALIANTVFLWIYLYMKEKRYRAAIITGIIAIIVYRITVSRTILILMITCSLFLIIYSVMQIVRVTWILNILRFSMIILFGCSVYFTFFNKELGTLVNDANFLVRFSQGLSVYNKYGIQWFGSNIKFVKIADATASNPAVILDNGFLSLLFYYGIAVTGIFIIGITNLLWKAGKEKDQIMLVIVCLFLLAGFMERTVYMLQYNFTLLGMFVTLRNNCNININNSYDR